LYNIVIMKKFFIVKQVRPSILLSLERLDLKISYKAIIQSDDHKMQTLSISHIVCENSNKPYQSIVR
jgi:hypothetical protein